MNRGEKLNINISAPNLISICVDESSRGELSGRIYQCYSKLPQDFENVVQLLRLMENLYDCIRFPEAATESRSFVPKEKEDISRPEKLLSAEEILSQKGEAATFAVHVQFRQNSSWQGDAVWVERDIKVHFTSELELIKLIDSVLNV